MVSFFTYGQGPILLTMEEKKMIVNILENNSEGLSISDVIKISNLSRSAVRTILAELRGTGKVKFRRIGMAKVYSLNLREQIKRR